MTELADISDEALEAEVERRKRRKASAEEDRLLREFIYAMCTDKNDALHEVVSSQVKHALGGTDYCLFQSHPHRFVFQITGAYIGSR